MKTLLYTFLLMIFISINSIANAQTSYQLAGPIKVQIEGTSNIHDWEMGAEQGNGNAVFILDKNGVLSGLSSLTFSMPAESLKSEHKTMDKNAYKAMHTDKHSTITFTAVSSTVKPYGNKYQVQSKGKLTISGVTRDVDLIAICSVNPADRSIACSGSYKFKMTSYNVTPPSIMLGAIKTGDDITVKFDILFKTR
jgi:hypothetical protein